MAKLQKDVEFLRDSSVKNEEDHREIINKIDKWIETADTKYAPIWVARFLIWAGTIVGGAILIGAMTVIGQAYLRFN